MIVKMEIGEAGYKCYRDDAIIAMARITQKRGKEAKEIVTVETAACEEYFDATDHNKAQMTEWLHRHTGTTQSNWVVD